MTTQQEKAIRQAVADCFLSEGSYEDLKRLADGKRPHNEVTMWEPLEDMPYKEILDAVDSAVRHVLKAMRG